MPLSRNAPAAATAAASRTDAWLKVIGFGLLAHLVLALGQVHFGFAGLFERDGYFHAQLAYLLPERGLSREFRWTQLSLWRDHFADKDFLFHVVMAPFARLASEPIVGAKLFMALLVLAFFLGVHRMLRAHRVPAPLLFTALVAAMGPEFLLRLTMIRSHVLSLALLFLGLHFTLGRRWRALAILAFVYAWSYSFPFVLFISLSAYVLGQAVAGAKPDWRAPIIALAGSTAGLVVHPYSPESITSLLVHADVVLQLKTDAGAAFVRGVEIQPADTWSFIFKAPLLVASFPALALLGFRSGRRLTAETMGVLFTAAAWLVATLHSLRFIEYAAPLMALTWGFVARDVLGERSMSQLWIEQRAWRRGAMATIAIIAIAHVQALAGLYGTLRDAPPLKFRGAGAWMASHLREHEIALNLAWADFPDLFYAAPRQDYVWGIESRLSLWADPQRAARLNAMTTGLQTIDFGTLSRDTGARYAVVSKQVLSRGAIEPWLAYEDGDSVILDMQRDVRPPG